MWHFSSNCYATPFYSSAAVQALVVSCLFVSPHFVLVFFCHLLLVWPALHHKVFLFFLQFDVHFLFLCWRFHAQRARMAAAPNSPWRLILVCFFLCICLIKTICHSVILSLNPGLCCSPTGHHILIPFQCQSPRSPLTKIPTSTSRATASLDRHRPPSEPQGSPVLQRSKVGTAAR